MKGFHKILKLKIWNTYGNARAIADDIITSLMANHDCNPLLTTYASTIRQSLLSTIADIFSTDDENDDCDYIDESNGDVATWVIRIYSCDGNRGSKLSISQNHELFSRLIEKADSTDRPTFTDTLMALYRMHSSLRFAADKYRMSKKLSSDAELVSQRIDIKSKAHDIIHCIEDLYNTYPSFMKSKEADVNDVIRNVTDIMNRIEFDESRYTVD